MRRGEGLTAGQFWWLHARVDKSDQCWVWDGTITPNGYAFLRARGCNHLAHRVAYQLFRGEISSDLCCDHLCRNRGCVNPWHLELVTLGENVLRGEGITARQKRLTHCPQGHPYSGDNLVVKASGFRACRICINAQGREYKRKRRLDPEFREICRVKENARYAAKKAVMANV